MLAPDGFESRHPHHTRGETLRFLPLIYFLNKHTGVRVLNARRIWQTEPMALRSWLRVLLKRRAPRPKGRTALEIVVAAGPQGLMRRLDVEMLTRAVEHPASEGPVDAWHQQLARRLRQERQRRGRQPEKH